ncbi:MAG: sigma-70 family RNA polymerase sigma factor [Chitinivibrionales bacterium]|nr:sigma-70 family RNA polymerase sigma factor [Chitinivibrionales bacterium]MBD3396935.1 sigma-70 family RNA polymerase sigma factor [Chitinivibrionales bacterium]
MYSPRKAGVFTNENSLAIYLKEIAKSKPLSRDEESSLAKRIRKGDQAALQKLVKANLRFVVSVAHNYENQGVPLSDLINEGNLGLIRAAKRFDERKAFKFISYAVWWIRQAILQSLAHHSRITKMPLNQVAMIYKIGQAESRLAQQYARTPDEDEVAEELQAERRRIRDVTRVGNRAVSLDATLQSRKNSSLMDVLCDSRHPSPEDHLEHLSLQSTITEILQPLSDRERRVVRYYFGIEDGCPLTLDEIGQRMRLTRERVRQIKHRALHRLKQSVPQERFAEVLET